MAVLAGILGGAAAALGALVGGARAAWSIGRVGRARRGARRSLKRVDRTLREGDERVERARAELDAAWRAYADAGREARIAATPVEALKAEGVERAPWKDLRAAGFRTLADLRGAKAATLVAAPGVGEVSAPRLVAATKRALEAIARQPPGLPPADLGGPGEERLGFGAVRALGARELLVPPLRAARAERERVGERGREAGRLAAFWRWLLGGARRRAEGAAAQEAARRACEELETGRELDELARAHERLDAFELELGDSAAMRRVFRERYADCSAVLERAARRVSRGAHVPAEPAQGGLPEEVAARIEAHPLEADDLSVTLRGYQEFGARFALCQRRVILGDEMGLGKTIQALAAMAHLEREAPGGRYLVVAPAAVVFNWKRELEARSALAPRLLYGDGLDAEYAEWLARGGVALTSYTSLWARGLAEHMLAADATTRLVVLDEAHLVKNPEARRSVAVTEVTALAERALLMSGTPMENRPREFVALLRVLGVGGTSRASLDELERYAESNLAERFRAAAAEVYLRRNQRDVLHELPERIEYEEWVELGAPERAAYVDALSAGNMMAMRRAASIGDGTVPSAKLERLAELLEEHREEGRKVVLFSYFLDVLAAVERRFGAIGTISGRLAPEKRVELIAELGAHEGHALLLCQITAGGVGLNMQAAQAAVLFEPQFKPTVEEQAVARVHRMGQPADVLVHRLLARGSVDERLVELLREKAELFDAFARESRLKDASAQATATKSLEREILERERARLGVEAKG